MAGLHDLSAESHLHFGGITARYLGQLPCLSAFVDSFPTSLNVVDASSRRSAVRIFLADRAAAVVQAVSA
jgi:hypothetical protein